MDHLKETLLRKEVVYQGNYLRTEKLTVRLPDGSEANREIVCPPDAAAILPIDDAGCVYLVRQYRTAIGQLTLEIPAGIIDPGEKPIETAERECAEEIAMRPERLDFLFKYHHAVGFSSGQIAVFLGRDLIPQSGSHLDAGEFIEVVKLPFKEVYQMAQVGEIVDSKTLLALLWYQQNYV